MSYCDSSFLVSLYVMTNVFNPLARKEAAKFTSVIPYTLLNELEFMNAIRRGLSDGFIDQADHATVIREVGEDERDGLLDRASLNQIKLYEKALDLSKKYTPALACRALDILHVASAIVLGEKKFATFDYRQRKLAAAIGFTLVPASLPRTTLTNPNKP